MGQSRLHYNSIFGITYAWREPLTTPTRLGGFLRATSFFPLERPQIEREGKGWQAERPTRSRCEYDEIRTSKLLLSSSRGSSSRDGIPQGPPPLNRITECGLVSYNISREGQHRSTICNIARPLPDNTMTVMARLLLMLSIPLVALCQTIALPPPPGSNVFITHLPLTDHSRVDPWAPCCNKPRRLMLTLFQPANCTQTQQIPYMPPVTAAFHDASFASIGIPNGTFEAFRLQTCRSAPKITGFPLVLFSTGMGVSRLMYSVLCPVGRLLGV